MRPLLTLVRRSQKCLLSHSQRRQLLTLAIETSCDDTGVAIIEKLHDGSAHIHFNKKITSDNRLFGGINPVVAGHGHQKYLARLVDEAVHNLPQPGGRTGMDNGSDVLMSVRDGVARMKPDFVTVTRGPGMRSCLNTGMDTAKGLAAAWQIPFLGVNHMEAHALTPRLLNALDPEEGVRNSSLGTPRFPFLTLLVSGGHTMLVHSKGLCDHQILANTVDVAIGNCLDKCATDILPLPIRRAAKNVMFGPLIETFAMEGSRPAYTSFTSSLFRPYLGSQDGFKWKILAPYTNPGDDGHEGQAHNFTFSGIASIVRQTMQRNPDMDIEERKSFARGAMTIAFEHLASRILLALQKPELKDSSTLVVSGGVARNEYMKEILRVNMAAKGHPVLKVVFPDPEYCTDNAAMIGWTGIEMFEAGWRSKWDATCLKEWSIDPKSPGGGILGAGGWVNVNDTPKPRL